ncbi:hypothetical protein J7K24_03060 [bacterium]|nr:hypothetical protein [bacterium]
MKEKIIYIKQNWRNEPSLPLFVATFLYTVAFIFTLIIDFLSKDFRTPQWSFVVYGSLLSAYVFSKEFGDRWILKIKWIPRKGDLFVYIWIGLSFVMYLVEYLSCGIYQTPPMVGNIATTVICLYVFSRISKYFYNRRNPYNRIYEDFVDKDSYLGPSILFPK